MITGLENKKNGQILLLTVVIALAVFGYYNNLPDTVIAIGLLCGGLLLSLLFFFAFEWYYILLIALIPLSVDLLVLGGAKLSFPSEGMLAIALPLVLVFNKAFRSVLKQAAHHPLTILLLCWIAMQLLTGLLSTHIDVSLKRFLIQFLFLSGFFGLVQLISDQRKLTALYLAYCIGLIPVMYHTIRTHAYHGFDPRVVFSICEPFYNDHTVYGACLAFVFPFMLIVVFHARMFGISGWMKTGLGLLTIAIFVSELLALSRAALLSLVVALLFRILLRYRVSFKRIVWGILILLTTIGAFHERIYEQIEQNEAVSNDGQLVNHFSSVSNIKSDASNLERINRWICAYRMFETKPFSGFGPGTYQFEYNRFQTVANKTYISTNAGDRGNAHSEYLSALSEMGIGGGILFVLLVFMSLYYGMENHDALKDPLLRNLNLAALLGLVTFFFHGIFNAFLDQSKMAFLVFTALGIIVWIHQRLRHEISS